MRSGPSEPAFSPVYPAAVARLILATALAAALVLLGWLLHIDRLMSPPSRSTASTASATAPAWNCWRARNRSTARTNWR